MCLSHSSSNAEYEKYREKRLSILRNLGPSYRTQRTEQADKPSVSTAPAVGTLSQVSYLKQSTGLAVCLRGQKNACLYLGEGGTQPHMQDTWYYVICIRKSLLYYQLHIKTLLLFKMTFYLLKEKSRENQNVLKTNTQNPSPNH